MLLENYSLFCKIIMPTFKVCMTLEWLPRSQNKAPMISCYMQDLLARTLCLMVLFNLVYFSLKKWLLTNINIKTPKLSLYKVERTWSFLANKIFSNNLCTYEGMGANEPWFTLFCHQDIITKKIRYCILIRCLVALFQANLLQHIKYKIITTKKHVFFYY